MNPLQRRLVRFLSRAGALLAAGVFFAGAAARAGDPTVRKIPVEEFFDRPQIASPAVSPDGRRVAFLAPVAERMAVVVFDLTTGKVAPVGRAYDADISDFYWKGNDRIVFEADPNGRESNAIIAVDLHGNVTVLAENFRENRSDAAYASIIDPLRFDPDHLLVAGRSSKGGFGAGLYWVNVRTADRYLVSGNDFDTSDWRADAEGHVRYRHLQGSGRTIIQVRSNARARWRQLATFPGEVAAVYSPIGFLGFSRTSPTLWLSREDAAGHDAIYGYNPETDQWGEPVFSAPEPITRVRFSWDRDRIESVTYGPDGRTVQWLDRRLEAIAHNLRAAFPAAYDLDLVSSDQQEKVWIALVHSDVYPGAYYMLDLRGRPQLVELGKVRPALHPEELQPMRPIAYAARDGLTIHGYLTLPAGAAGRRRPLVLNPHGGPYGVRDSWRYNGEVQMLANRGYAVLQVNYRGSGGYGLDFLLAGKHEWGRRMQDDLTDAVHWAVAEGIADPRRVCIYGASYGGYAALAGAVFTPDLYCCAVNYVGVADLRLITDWEHEDARSGEAYYRDMVGDDPQFLHDYSPVNFVQNIRIPTLHAYGENDPRVVIRHWHELESQLKRYHKNYEFIYQGNEGHGFHEAKARIDFYRKLDSFLATNCPP